MKHTLAKRIGASLLTAVLLSTSAAAAVDGAPVNPKNPYGPPISGTFHNQKVADYTGNYTVYIPENYEFCSPAVMILTPDGQSAETFFQSSEGQAWKKLCDAEGIAAVIAEPADGTWNLADAPSARDDEAYLKKVFDTTRSKSTDIAAAFDMNERAFYLIGYEEGGSAAQEFAMTWPAIMCGVATVGGSAVPADVMKTVGDALSYPFAQADSLKAQEENALPNKDIPVPMWIIESDDAAENSDAVLNYWVEANDAEKTAASAPATAAYVNPDNDRERVWVTSAAQAKSLSPDKIYDELEDIQRFVGDPGGRLEWKIEHTNNGKSGYFTHEETVGNATRRWMTYVPSTYDGKTEVPLVVATHGYSSAMTAFTGDTRWQDVAEKHGFIVVFPQAYPNYYPGRGNISVPVWHNYAYPLDETATDDVGFIRYIVAQTEKEYSIDSTRLYATGHSNGSSMAWGLANDCQDLFAACAPIGWQKGAIDESAPAATTVMPIWTCMGEYDLGAATKIEEGNENDVSIKGWIARNQTAAVPTVTTAADGRFRISTYTNAQGVPLFNYAEILNSPHAYMPSQAEYLYEEFFSKFSRKDGVVYYNGKAVENPYSSFKDLNSHWAKNAAEKAVARGWFSGTSADAFSPDDAATRGMVVTVLGRTAKAAGNAEAAAKFKDAAADAYYTPYIGWAVSSKIASGTSETSFSPDENITREQFAVMAANYAQMRGLNIEPVSKSMDQLADAEKVSDWAKAGVEYCVGHGLLSGNEKNELAPQNTLTRAEMATILNRLLV